MLKFSFSVLLHHADILHADRQTLTASEVTPSSLILVAIGHFFFLTF